MPSASQIAEALRVSTNEWIAAIERIPNEVFNTPRENSWSLSQIAMHMVLVEKGIVGILTGHSVERDASRKSMLEKIEHGLTSRDHKIKAPSFLNPRLEAYDKQRVIDKFKANREQLEAILLNSPELDRMFPFPHPFFGLLTGIEWAHNVVLHANRHLQQLEAALAETHVP